MSLIRGGNFLRADRLESPDRPAQDPRGTPTTSTGGSPATGITPDSDRTTEPLTRPATPILAENTPSTATVQDVLLRPYHFPFSRPTSLLQVSAHLKQTLKIPVVLDIAALARQEVDPDDTVQLDLDGVRLKTGLKLLLDQVDLTYHVVAEDNLLIITDRQGSEEPLDRVWNEMKAMHREIHDLQDALDQLMDSLVVEKGDGSRVRKPTIIEEMPEIEGPKAQDPREKPEESSKKPKGERRPDPAPRSPTSRVPLIGPGRPL